MQKSIDHFLDTLDRSPRTIRAYKNALKQFIESVGQDASLTVETFITFLKTLKNKSGSTQRQYRTAVLKFYSFCNAGHESELQKAVEHYTRKKPGKTIINPPIESIDRIIEYAQAQLTGDLIGLRDRAFILTLSDTGLRISEACALTRADVDWRSHTAFLENGKGDKQAVIYFSDRAIKALEDYLRLRSQVEPMSRRPIGSQPLFARHDISASRRIKPVHSSGMWKAVKGRMSEAGVDKTTVRLHDFRHYFVTYIYTKKKDLKLAQILARHESLQTTNRYAHLNGETQAAYNQIFNDAKGAKR